MDERFSEWLSELDADLVSDQFVKVVCSLNVLVLREYCEAALRYPNGICKGDEVTFKRLSDGKVKLNDFKQD